MTRTAADDLARLSDRELLEHLCGTNGPSFSLSDLLWRDAAARLPRSKRSGLRSASS